VGNLRAFNGPRPDKLYDVSKAARFLQVRKEVVKGQCTIGTMQAERIGPQKELRISGAEIIRMQRTVGGKRRRYWNPAATA
jgi:hypothetical protein